MAALQQRDEADFFAYASFKEEDRKEIYTKANPDFFVYTSGDSAGFVYSDAADAGIAV